MLGGELGGGDFGGRLGRQLQLEAVDEEAQVGLGLGEAGKDDLAAVGGGQMHVDHLQGGELLERATRGQAWGEVVQAAGQGDLQAIGEEGDEDVGFDTLLVLMEDRADREVALEVPESFFDIP